MVNVSYFHHLSGHSVPQFTIGCTQAWPGIPVVKATSLRIPAKAQPTRMPVAYSDWSALQGKLSGQSVKIAAQLAPPRK